MRRTQIYLDETQRKALKLLAAEADASVSDLIREAVDKLLRERVASGDWATRLGAWQDQVRERLGDVSLEQVDAALSKVRAARKKP